MSFFRILSSARTSWRSFRKDSPRLENAFSILFWLPSGIIFTKYFYTVKSISGRSMQPTLNPDYSAWRDIAIFDRYSIIAEHRYERGDIVALKSPIDNKLIVKRIIALPGDTVKTLAPYPDAEVRLPEGYTWVEGDESFNTEDSNHFGPVSLSLIDSKLTFIVWPPARYGPLSKPKYPDPKAERGPAWRRDTAAIERERWRRSRVAPAL